MEESRYSWKKMSEDYNASYYNDEDFYNGKKFTVIDNRTGREYICPEIETRRTDDGRVYDQKVIDNHLWNEEFLAWAICTSEDFIKGLRKEFLTPKILNYVVDHFEFPSIFKFHMNNRLRDVMTRDLWNKAFHRNKEVVNYVPKEYVTTEMINSLGEIKNPSIGFGHISFEDLTPELFEKIYFNSDSEHKLKLISPAPTYRDDPSNSLDGKVTNLISQKIADDILSINIRTIWVIPKKFISKENAIKAMEEDFALMSYVPVEYQTINYQKRAIDEKPENLSLIDPSVLTDEMIYYALSKKGSVLGCVPKERRTLEVCDFAVSNNGIALRSVPDKVKNLQLCFKAVVNDPKAIKYVPVEFLTQEFLSELNKSGVVIPMRNRKYVDYCLNAHKKLEEQQLNFDEAVSSTPKMDINSDYSNIKLESLPGLLSAASLKILTRHNIYTVGELLSISDNSAFYGMILGDSTGVYKEIRGSIKLLKCKYMNVDPMIDFVDAGDTFVDMRDFANEIGFSTRTESVLLRAGISPKRLSEIMKSPDRDYKLHQIRNSGDRTVQEIIYKITIINDYYDKKAEKATTATDDETIETLNEELAQIRAEIQRLNARTDEVLAKIQEKMLEKGKGGVLK